MCRELGDEIINNGEGSEEGSGDEEDGSGAPTGGADENRARRGHRPLTTVVIPDAGQKRLRPQWIHDDTLAKRRRDIHPDTSREHGSVGATVGHTAQVHELPIPMGGGYAVGSYDGQMADPDDDEPFRGRDSDATASEASEEEDDLEDIADGQHGEAWILSLGTGHFDLHMTPGSAQGSYGIIFQLTAEGWRRLAAPDVRVLSMLEQEITRGFQFPHLVLSQIRFGSTRELVIERVRNLRNIRMYCHTLENLMSPFEPERFLDVESVYTVFLEHLEVTDEIDDYTALTCQFLIALFECLQAPEPVEMEQEIVPTPVAANADMEVVVEAIDVVAGMEGLHVGQGVGINQEEAAVDNIAPVPLFLPEAVYW